MNVRETIFYSRGICHQVSAIAVIDGCRVPNVLDFALTSVLSARKAQVRAQAKSRSNRMVILPLNDRSFTNRSTTLVNIGPSFTSYVLRKDMLASVSIHPVTCENGRSSPFPRQRRTLKCFRCDWIFSLKWHIEW